MSKPKKLTKKEVQFLLKEDKKEHDKKFLLSQIADYILLNDYETLTAEYDFRGVKTTKHISSGGETND